MAEKDADNPERLIEYLDSKIKKKEEEEERKNITISKKDQLPKKQRRQLLWAEDYSAGKTSKHVKSFPKHGVSTFRVPKKGMQIKL